MTDRQDEQLQELIAMLPPMTPAEQLEQRLDFAYGNLAATNRHKPNRAAFKRLAVERGWTEEQFKAWAQKRRWWMGRMLMLVPIRSDTELAQERARSLDEYGGEPTGGFTCDDCGIRSTCALVFDWYNTNGDCLAEK